MPKSKLPGAVVAGVGVDLVNLKRVRDFLQQHSPKQVARLLSSGEQKRFRKGRISALIFAKIFTAKEAFFKTLNQSWMGLEGFSFMETQFFPKDRFHIQLVDGPLARKGKKEAWGSFFQVENLIGAQVVRTE